MKEAEVEKRSFQPEGTYVEARGDQRRKREKRGLKRKEKESKKEGKERPKKVIF